MDGFNVRVISLSPWVDGSLPGLEGKMLADIHESKDINDFSFSHLGQTPGEPENFSVLFCLMSEDMEGLILI